MRWQIDDVRERTLTQRCLIKSDMPDDVSTELQAAVRGHIFSLYFFLVFTTVISLYTHDTRHRTHTSDFIYDIPIPLSKSPSGVRHGLCPSGGPLLAPYPSRSFSSKRLGSRWTRPRPWSLEAIAWGPWSIPLVSRHRTRSRTVTIGSGTRCGAEHFVLPDLSSKAAHRRKCSKTIQNR